MKKNRFGPFGRRTLSNLVVVGAGVLLYMALLNLTAVRSTLAWFLSIFSPFFIGIAIAYLLNIPMRFFETRVYAKLQGRRPLAIVTVYLLAVLALVLLGGLVIPQLIESVRTLLSNVTLYLDNINELVTTVGTMLELRPETIDAFFFSYSDLVNEIATWARSALPDLLGMGYRLTMSVVTALTALIASIYMLASKEKLLRQVRRVLYAILPQRAATQTMRVGNISNRVFSGFIGGKILDSAIIGVICFTFMSLMNVLSSMLGVEAIRMPYAPLISVFIGITNVIPFFGPFIGAIPSIMILLMVNPWNAIWFTVFIIVLQQFDGNILGPKILGDSTGLPAIWVLVSILVGGGLFGFMGMLLGVPTTAVLYTLAADFVAGRLRRKGLDEQEGLASPAAAPTTEEASPPVSPPAPPPEETTT
ncbi:AI-2E family transporter [Ruminococcaceae bacterium OttesenSCG-928-O06]|nr:AI-2E family transporter [Ruminococcaceae bacterium OttesenSCG-928-O06]